MYFAGSTWRLHHSSMPCLSARVDSQRVPIHPFCIPPLCTSAVPGMITTGCLALYPMLASNLPGGGWAVASLVSLPPIPGSCAISSRSVTLSVSTVGKLGTQSGMLMLGRLQRGRTLMRKLHDVCANDMAGVQPCCALYVRGCKVSSNTGPRVKHCVLPTDLGRLEVRLRRPPDSVMEVCCAPSCMCACSV